MDTNGIKIDERIDKTHFALICSCAYARWRIDLCKTRTKKKSNQNTRVTICRYIDWWNEVIRYALQTTRRGRNRGSRCEEDDATQFTLNCKSKLWKMYMSAAYTSRHTCRHDGRLSDYVGRWQWTHDNVLFIRILNSRPQAHFFLFQWSREKSLPPLSRTANHSTMAEPMHHSPTAHRRIEHRHIFHPTYMQRNLYVIGVWNVNISNSNVFNAAEKLCALSRIMDSKYIEIWLAAT